jgi:hypothetical protein
MSRTTSAGNGDGIAAKLRDWAVLWPAWTPTISVSSSPCCGMPAVAAGRHVIPQKIPQASACDD